MIEGRDERTSRSSLAATTQSALFICRSIVSLRPHKNVVLRQMKRVRSTIPVLLALPFVHVTLSHNSIMSNHNVSGPVLQDIRVVELATVVAAPSCGALMCDFGAQVIKVESPSGDMWRKEAIALAPSGQTFGNLFENANRGKLSIVLDLKQTEDRRKLFQLLETADVFLTNVRVKALERLGLHYRALNERFPKLVYAHLTAWGRRGPFRDEPGYDAGAFWSATGIQDITRASDDAPPSRYPGGIGDHTTGLALLGGIALALYHRERTGHGQLVDASLLRTGAWVNAVPMMLSAGDQGHRGARGQRRGREAYSIPTFNTYRTKDGRWIQLLGLEFKRHIKSTLSCLGLEHLLDGNDPRFSTYKNIRRNRRDLIALMSKAFASKTLDEWTALLRSHDVWFTAMRKFEDALTSRELIESSGVDSVKGIGHGLISSPVKLSSFAHKARGRAPVLGAHTDLILGEEKALRSSL